MTVSAIYIGDYTNLTTDKITNLYLYGTLTTPNNYEDRLRSSTDYNNLPVDSANNKYLPIELEMPSYMATGPGRYAHASEANVVKDFFNGDIAVQAGHTYTKAQIKSQFGYTDQDFNIAIQHLDINSISSDYALRTYIYNNSGFKISDDVIFKVDGSGNLSIENMAVHAFIDDFDFESGGWWTQLGNDLVLKDEIDPYDIGIKVRIEFLNKLNVATHEQKNNGSHYDLTAFENDHATVTAEDNGSVIDALPAMTDLVDGLKASGTIKYETVDGLVVYGSNSAESIEGNSGKDTLIAGEGNDTFDGDTGNDILIGGSGTDTYEFNGLFGADRVSDTGGTIKVDGSTTISVNNTTHIVTIGTRTFGVSLQNGDLVLTDTANTAHSITIDNYFNNKATWNLPTIAGDSTYTYYYGTSGNNTIAHNPGSNMYQYNAFFMGGGDDYVYVPWGYNQLFGGDGNDTLGVGGGVGAAYVDGGAGADSIAVLTSSGVNTVIGGTGDDTIGVNYASKVYWEAGDGNDTLNLSTTSSANTLYITGDAERSDFTVYRNTGTDLFIRYEPTGEVIKVTDQFISGGVRLGNFYVGDDTVAYGLSSIQEYHGTAAADTFNSSTTAQTIDGGEGVDLVSYQNSNAGVSVDLAGGTFSGGHAQGDFLTGIENITGSAYADTITGDSGANSLSGLNGNDILNGDGEVSGFSIMSTGGNDTLSGGDGNDTLNGNGGQDRLTGGNGVDVFTFTDRSDSSSDAKDTVTDLVNTSNFSEQNYIDLTGLGFAYVNLNYGYNNKLSSKVLNVDYNSSTTFYTLNAGDNSFGIVIEGGGFVSSNVIGLATNSAATVTGWSATPTYTVGGAAVSLDNSITISDSDDADLFHAYVHITDLDDGANEVLAVNVGSTGLIVDTSTAGWLVLNGKATVAQYESVLETLTYNNTATTPTLGDRNLTLVVSDDITNSTVANLTLTLSPNGPTITGTSSGETLTGTTGNDWIVGLGGNDTLDGGNGDDTLEGGTGADSLIGGSGNDTASYANSSSAVTINLGSTVSGGDAAGDMLSSIEHLIGSAYNDVLNGDNANNSVSGGAGIDSINTSNGNDTVNGNAEDDFIQAGHGNNTVDAGDGDDYVTGGDNLDLLYGGSGGDQLYAGGDNDTVWGGSGTDFIVGADGNDILYGEADGDVIQGNNGNDTIIGGGGGDSIDGHAGTDIYRYTSLSDSNRATALDKLSGFTQGTDKIDVTSLGIVGLGTGTNMLKVTVEGDKTYVELVGGTFSFRMEGSYTLKASDFLGFTGTGTAGVSEADAVGIYNDTLNGSSQADWLQGGTGDDTLYGNGGPDLLEGGAGSDAIYGNTDNDTLKGGDNGDYMLGNEGNDLIYGENDNDAMEGNDGDDTLIGGGGRDTMSGNTGDDVFKFVSAAHSSTTNGYDRILDFVQGDDIIDLAGLGLSFSGLTISQTTKTYVEDTVSGFGIEINGLVTLTAGDFIFS